MYKVKPNGEPILSAGVLTIEDVFDAATGDYITTNVTFHGPLRPTSRADPQ